MPDAFGVDPLVWTCEIGAGSSAGSSGTVGGTSELAISATDADSGWSSCGALFKSHGPLYFGVGDNGMVGDSGRMRSIVVSQRSEVNL